MAVATGDLVAGPSVFRIRLFQVVVVADLVSIFGSQVARFALAVLVYHRTDSALASAVTYALTFLPAAAGGFVLGRFADRYSERAVMIVSDLLRAVLFLAMSLPGLGVGVICGLLVVAVFLDPAFDSAVLSLLARRLTIEQLRASSAWRSSVEQVTQVVAFGLGGVIVLAIGSPGALRADALTFVASAAMIGLLVRDDGPLRRAVAPDDAGAAAVVDAGVDPGDEDEFRGVWRDARTRFNMMFNVLYGFCVLPEALVVVYSAWIRTGTAQAGVLLAMGPLGTAVGFALISYVPARARSTVADVLCVLCGVPLVVCAWRPGLVVSCVCWFLCGLLTAYQVEVITGLVTGVPDRARSHFIGIISAWRTIAQGVCFALAGVLTLWLSPGATVALGGATATVGAVLALGARSARGRRVSRPT